MNRSKLSKGYCSAIKKKQEKINKENTNKFFEKQIFTKPLKISKYYRIDLNGNIYSLPRKNSPQLIKMKPKINHGYKRINIFLNGKIYNLAIHRLIYETFKGKLPKKAIIHHKDGNRLNNSLNNLELIRDTKTHSYMHKPKGSIPNFAKKGFPKGEEVGNSKLKEKDIVKIKKLLLTKKYSHREIAKLFNVCKATITHINCKRNWKWFVR